MHRFTNIIESFFKNGDGFTLKAANLDDDVYVDEQGRHIIFRTIRGQIVPIRATAQDYAEWLQKQGIDVDPADQKTLRQIEQQMDMLDEARRIGGPELQQQYQEAFQKNLEQYQQVSQQYYQQALQQQAEKREAKPEQLHEQKKQIYEKHKDKTIDRRDLEDRGWGSFVEAYTDRLIKNLGVGKENSAWYQMKAFDLMLMKAMDLAKEGVHPSNVDLEKLIDEEMTEKTPGLEKYYKDRYAPLADEEVSNYEMPLQIYNGVKKLKDYFNRGHEAAAFFREAFDSVYGKMYNDFNQQDQSSFSDIPSEQFEGLSKEISGIPEELPEQFSDREASSVFNIYKKWKGSRTSAAHRVTRHALGRLYNSIPSDETGQIVLKLSNPDSGLHAIHKQAYRDMYARYTIQGRDINVDHEVEEILRLTNKASSGTTSDKINAMKEIAERLGRIDGMAVLKSGDVKNAQSHTMRWQNVAVTAGMQKGDGPNLIQTLIEPTKRNAFIYPNSALKVPHQPTKQTPAKPEFQDLPEVATEEEPERDLKEGEVYPGFRSEGNKIVSKDGFVITTEGGLWDIKSPTGQRVARIKIKPQPKENLEKAKESYFGMVESLIEEFKQTRPDEFNKGRQEEGKTRIPVFNFSPDLSDTDNKHVEEITEYIHDAGLEVTQKIPGLVYRMKSGDSYMDFVYNKQKSQLMLSYHDERSGIVFESPSLDKVKEHFKSPESEPVRENNPPPKELPEDTRKLKFSEQELDELLGAVGEENIYWQESDGGFDVYMPAKTYENWTKRVISQKSSKNVVSTFRL